MTDYANKIFIIKKLKVTKHFLGWWTDFDFFEGVEMEDPKSGGGVEMDYPKHGGVQMNFGVFLGGVLSCLTKFDKTEDTQKG